MSESAGEPIRVMLVDDQELIRTGFALILGTAPDIEVVAEAGDGEEALRVVAELARSDRAPHIVLMDVRMPGLNGIEATGLLAKEHPEIRVLVLTTFDLDEYAAAAIEAGASGFLLKDARAAELIHAVRAVADGDAVLAPSVTGRLLAQLRGGNAFAEMSPFATPEAMTLSARNAETLPQAKAAGLDSLSDREREVFDLVAQGLSNSEIGEQLFLSASTVKTHISRVLAKLDLRDRVHVVIFAYELGLR